MLTRGIVPQLYLPLVGILPKSNISQIAFFVTIFRWIQLKTAIYDITFHYSPANRHAYIEIKKRVFWEKWTALTKVKGKNCQCGATEVDRSTQKREEKVRDLNHDEPKKIIDLYSKSVLLLIQHWQFF